MRGAMAAAQTEADLGFELIDRISQARNDRLLAGASERRVGHVNVQEDNYFKKCSWVGESSIVEG